MQRRQFGKTTWGLMAAAGLGLAAGRPPKTLKGRRLKAGDTVGLITPASYISDEALQKAHLNMEGMGFRVKLGEHVRAERGFTAGTDAQRLADLHGMFADPQVAAVWCARGGYGTARLLPLIDYGLIRRHPKALIGYSDITALLQAIWAKAGLMGIHGPVGASDFTPYTQAHLHALLTEPADTLLITPPSSYLDSGDAVYQHRIITPGQATGRLLGGNLSLLAAAAGTPYMPDVRGSLLFIEDIGEKPYRIDRMLTQLRQALPLHKTAGILLGIFHDCQPGEGERSLSLHDTLHDRLHDLGVPVACGFPIGHIAHQCSLPIGARASFDTLDLSIRLLEPAVL